MFIVNNLSENDNESKKSDAKSNIQKPFEVLHSRIYVAISHENTAFKNTEKKIVQSRNF